jgi:hypothetical protein
MPVDQLRGGVRLWQRTSSEVPLGSSWRRLCTLLPIASGCRCAGAGPLCMCRALRHDSRADTRPRGNADHGGWHHPSGARRDAKGLLQVQRALQLSVLPPVSETSSCARRRSTIAGHASLGLVTGVVCFHPRTPTSRQGSIQATEVTQLHAFLATYSTTGLRYRSSKPQSSCPPRLQAGALWQRIPEGLGPAALALRRLVLVGLVTWG